MLAHCCLNADKRSSNNRLGFICVYLRASLLAIALAWRLLGSGLLSAFAALLALRFAADWLLLPAVIGITVRAGHCLSLQFHQAKEETISLLTGAALVEYGADASLLVRETFGPGDTIVGQWQLCRDDLHWADDLQITYRRQA